MSDNVIHIDIQINEQAIYAKTVGLLSDPQVMTEVHRVFADIIDPWVPMDTGELATNLTIDETGVTYNAYDESDGHYAAKNYYGIDIKHKKDKHPLATAYWDKVAMQTERERLAQEVKDILVRKANNG